MNKEHKLDECIKYFKVITRDGSSPEGKCRVFFTCHRNDFDKYFKMICNDIFRMHDCAIYYTDDMTSPIPEQYKKTGLGKMNLIVIPVTNALLTEKNRAMDSDVEYAIRDDVSIPILPIVVEPSIDLMCEEKFGNRQYLSRFTLELAEINYEDKLRAYLNFAFLDDKVIDCIRAIAHASDDTPEHYYFIGLAYLYGVDVDINAIRALEFLTIAAEKNYSLAVKKLYEIFSKGQHFKIDYNEALKYIKKAYSLALNLKGENHADTVAILNDLAFIYTKLNLHNEAIKELEKAYEIATKIFDKNSSEISFIACNLADAYINLNKYEISLMEYSFACSNIDSNNYMNAFELVKKIYKQSLIQKTSDTKTIVLLYNLACISANLNDFEKSFEFFKKALKISHKVYGENSSQTFVILKDIASAYFEYGNYKKAIELGEKAYNIAIHIYGQNNIVTIKMEFQLGSYRLSYIRKGEAE